MKKILIIEDNPHDEKFISSFLKKSFDCSITTTESLSVARSLLLGNTVFDVIVIDSTLRGFQEGGVGVSLFPVITEGLSKKAILLRFSKNETSLQEARNYGMKAYHSDILLSDKKLDDNCDLL